MKNKTIISAKATIIAAHICDLIMDESGLDIAELAKSFPDLSLNELNGYINELLTLDILKAKVERNLINGTQLVTVSFNEKQFELLEKHS
ncbi:hypothetical protein VCRA2114E365_130118 [Vibrio crassostreae]|nr:hypothetical protein VCHA43P273_60225 [Vibrio chagasii]CAK1731853.1 hypothetical protein VCRA2115O371_120029 [Vibrio crassostreae]CAK1745401.1 hypothetical protein VCRA2114O367_130030 [Vibrio crassostreae]CAK1746000.1 hypothetical protein VCRA2113O354_130029 [Vibrio crassostreae]CAK1746929.1 hypothetical protein VCRA2117O376_130029 [Vibrio crassostreae]